MTPARPPSLGAGANSGVRTTSVNSNVPSTPSNQHTPTHSTRHLGQTRPVAGAGNQSGRATPVSQQHLHSHYTTNSNSSNALQSVAPQRSSSQPSPSPPARPLPHPRTYPSTNNLALDNNISPTNSSPPDSPVVSNDTIRNNGQTAYNRSRYRTSTDTVTGSNTDADSHNDNDDNYSPKRKQRISLPTIVLCSLLAFLCMMSIAYLFHTATDSNSGAFNPLQPSASEYAEPVYSYEPLTPLLPAHHTTLLAQSLPLSVEAPVVIDIKELTNSWATVTKKLPFHPTHELSNTGRLPEPSQRLPSDHPWYTPLPVPLPDTATSAVRKPAIYYQPDVTPRHLRKVAVPGMDDALVYLIDLEPDAQKATNTTGATTATTSTDRGKVIVGVKPDKSFYLGADTIEWSEEEKTAMRLRFRNVTLNRNIGSSIIWQPMSHTLKLLKEYPLPNRVDGQFLFGDEYLFVLLTEKKNHGLIRKHLSSWGQYVKHWQIYSDFYDSKINTTVLINPLPTAIPRDLKNQPWRVPAMINHLAKSDHLHRQFYVFVDQYSFPLLDQLKWRFDQWLSIWSNQFPSLIAGRPDKKPAKLSYWPDHQDLVNKLFSEPLQVIPKYAYGFDHQTLLQLHYYTPVDVCPVLMDEQLTLAALVQCAGGVTMEQHFLAMTRSSHREKGVVGDDLTRWRLLDVYSGERTAGMVEEAFNWYYGGLAKAAPPPVASGTNETVV